MAPALALRPHHAPRALLSDRATARRRPSAALLGLGALMLLGCTHSRSSPGPAAASPTGAEEAKGGSIGIPASMQQEHHDIHAALASATEAPGRVGEAARELARLLEPHFARENQIALPPLGLLRPLASGEFDPSMADVLPMTDALRRELPQMLREHAEIAAAAQRLERIAGEERNLEVQRLARALQAHARSEEELLYPAAILVGDLVRARLGRTREPTN